MRVPRLSALTLAVALTTIFAASNARAEERYETLFKEGRKQMTAKDYGKACTLFQESLDLGAPVGALLNLADCQDKLGHPARSLALWKEGLEKLPPDDPRRDLAKRAIDDVDLRVARIAVAGRAGANATAFVDGTSAAIGGAPITVDPGHHQVTVTDEDGTRTLDVSVGAGELRTVTAANTPHAGPSGWLVGGIVALGVGGAGLVGAAVTGGLWLGEKSTVDERCPTRPCDDDVARDAADRAGTLATANVVSWVVAGVGAAAGTTFLVLHATTSKRMNDSTTALIWTGTGLAVRQSF